MLGLGASINRGGFVSAAESLLLDEYSGAATAYSLRKLSNTYSGNAVKVRRASDNAELDIAFSDGGLDTSAIATHCGSSDGFVSVWYDPSSNSNNATQTTAADQPKIYDGTTGVVTENGKPAIEFDGSNDRLFSASTYTPTTSMAQIVVAKGTSSATDQIIGDSNDRRHGMALRIQSSNFKYFNGTGSSFNEVQITSNSNQNLHFYGRDTSSTFYARLNSSETSTSISAIDTTALNIYLGARHNGTLVLDGTMQEYVLYLTSQSANKTAIETDINNFYDIY